MPKWVKLLIAIGLIPVCLGAAKSLWLVLLSTGRADTIWVALIAGAACWMVIYLLLPKPMWIYVFGHELTHAVWTWIFGGRVKRFKTSSSGGHVVVTKTNFVIALAPYFFPLYVVIVVLLFLIGHLLWDWHAVTAWFHLFVGAAYAFHVTLTAHILKTRQSDITQQGYLFSFVVIFLGNIAVLLIGVPLLTAQVSLAQSLKWWFRATVEVLQRLGGLI